MFSLKLIIRALTACLILGGILIVLRPDVLDPLRATVHERLAPGPGAEVPKGSVPVKRQDQIAAQGGPASSGEAGRNDTADADPADAGARTDAVVQVTTSDADTKTDAGEDAKPGEEKTAPAAPDKITLSRPLVVSAVQLKGRKWTVSLADLSAPNAKEICKTPSGARWHCGAQARAALARLILRRRVECDVVARVSDDEVSGRCKIGPTDINGWVVRQGWAKLSAGSEYDGPYRKARDAARGARLGLWRQ